MTARYGFYILVSFAIHIGFLSIISNWQKSTKAPTNSVQVTILQNSIIKSETVTQKIRTKKFQLVPSLRSGLTPENSHFSIPKGTLTPQNWNYHESYTASDIDRFEGIPLKQTTYLKNIWTEINEAIPNSPYLYEYAQVGTVYLKFEVDQNGYLVSDSLRAEANNKVLKVFSARSVRKALRAENKDLIKPEQPTQIFVRFHWSDQTSCEKNTGINKNYLSFCRVSKSEKKSFSTGEKVGTYLSALQYGPGFFEEVEKYQKEENRRRTKFDAFQDLKLDPDWDLGS